MEDYLFPIVYPREMYVLRSFFVPDSAASSYAIFHSAYPGSSSLRIIQEAISLHEARLGSVAYFHFDFRVLDKQNGRHLLPSLLVQLSSWSDPCRDSFSHS